MYFLILIKLLSSYLCDGASFVLKSDLILTNSLVTKTSSTSFISIKHFMAFYLKVLFGLSAGRCRCSIGQPSCFFLKSLIYLSLEISRMFDVTCNRLIRYCCLLLSLCCNLVRPGMQNTADMNIIWVIGKLISNNFE